MQLFLIILLFKKRVITSGKADKSAEEMGALNSLMRLPFTIFSTIFAVLHKLFLYGIIYKELYYPYRSSQESFKRLFFCLRELMQWNMCKKKAFRILPIMNS